jgi:hypothetical protein
MLYHMPNTLKEVGQFSRHLGSARLRDELAELHRSFADELVSA